MADSDSYGYQREKDFVDGLGEWAVINRIKDHLTTVEWLQLYIDSHGPSHKRYHILAVDYARRKLDVLLKKK